MKFTIYSAPHLCTWDWTASGGSEQWHIELAQRLAARGHEVYSYAPVPWKIVRERTHKEVKWNHSENVDSSRPGIWIIQRDPDVVFRFSQPHPGQVLLMSAHDFDYTVTDQNGKIMTWVDRFDGILAESRSHTNFLQDKYPETPVYHTGAGLLLDRLKEVPNVERNPHRLIFSSSATRGLLHLLKIFKRAREEVTDLELAITYGWESIDAAIEGGFEASKLKRFKDRTLKFLDQPGVTWLGRLPTTQDVWTEMSRSGIWCMPSQFHETACNSAMEAQCFGAIPIVNPTWAVGDHTLHGVKIYGDPWDDRLVASYYVRAIIEMATDVGLQERIRGPMMEEARAKFDFDLTVDRIEALATRLWADRQREAA